MAEGGGEVKNEIKLKLKQLKQRNLFGKKEKAIIFSYIYIGFPIIVSLANKGDGPLSLQSSPSPITAFFYPPINRQQDAKQQIAARRPAKSASERQIKAK